MEACKTYILTTWMAADPFLVGTTCWTHKPEIIGAEYKRNPHIHQVLLQNLTKLKKDPNDCKLCTLRFGSRGNM